MTSSEDKALTRRECDHCELKTEVENMKGWVSRIDKRMWAFGAGLVLILLTTVANLAVLLFRTGGH